VVQIHSHKIQLFNYLFFKISFSLIYIIMSDPVPLPLFFDGSLPSIFNPSDYYQTTFIQSLQTTTLSSATISSSAVQVVDSSGNSKDVATHQDLDDLKALLLGSDDLQNSLNSIVEINNAINNDPNFYTTITTNIATKANQTDLDTTNSNVATKADQTDLDTTNSNLDVLDTRVDSAELTIVSHTATLASHTSTLSSHTSSISTINTNVSNLQSKTNAMSYSGNTLTMNENVVVTLDESLNGNVTIGNQTTDILTVNSATTFNGSVSGLTKSTVGLGNLDNTSDVNKPVSTAQQTALNLKANLASPTFTGTVNGITKSMVGLGNVDNTSDANKPVSTAQQTALDLKANQSALDTTNSNVTALQSKTNSMTFNAGTNTLTMNENVIVTLDEFLNGNTTIGNAGTDILTVNSATTFNGSVSGLTKSTVGLGNLDNTSDANKPVSTAQQTALNLKANLASPTFTGTVTVPDLSANDNSSKSANTKYVDTAISNLISSAPSALNTLNELATALGNDANYSTTITTALATKGALSANQTWSGDNTYSGNIVLNGTNLNTRLTTDETNITNLQSLTNKMAYNPTTNTMTMNEKVIVALDESLNGNVTIGDAGTDILTVNSATTFNGTVSGLTKSTVGLGNLDNTSDVNKPVSTAQQTALNLKANLASPTFTGTVSGITKSMVGLGSVDNTSDSGKPVSTAQQTALDLKANLASPTFTGTVSGITKSMVGLGSVDNTSDTGKPVSTAQQTALDLKANLASPTFTGTVSGITKSMVGLGNCDNTSDTGKPVSTAQQTALDLKATDSLTCHLSGTETVTGVKTFSANNVFSGTNNFNMLNENINYVSGITTSLSLDYTSGCKGVNLIATPTANYSLAITNVPTGSTNATYTITLISTAKYYVNSITVNGTSRTIYASGGTSNISVSASASYVMQQLNICFLNSSTPVVFSSVMSIW
jgi:arginine deiminase